MRTLKLHFPDDALPTLDTFIKQTKEARVFRRAQAVRHVVKGQRLQVVSDALTFTYSALRKWAYRFANQGVQGLVDRPRSGRPPKVTCALEQHLPAGGLVDAADDVEHGGLAGTVRSDQAADLSLVDGEGEAVEGDDATEADRHITYVE